MTPDEIVEEFDKFKGCTCKNVNDKCSECPSHQDYKDWLRTKLLTLTHSIEKKHVEQLAKMKQTLPKEKCINAEMMMFGRCFDCQKTNGYNQALTDAINTLTSTNELV